MSWLQRPRCRFTDYHHWRMYSIYRIFTLFYLMFSNIIKWVSFSILCTLICFYIFFGVKHFIIIVYLFIYILFFFFLNSNSTFHPLKIFMITCLLWYLMDCWSGQNKTFWVAYWALGNGERHFSQFSDMVLINR